MRERAAGSEDAFDAAVSALVMARHGDQLVGAPARPARVAAETRGRRSGRRERAMAHGP